jgi:hypothetical protein
VPIAMYALILHRGGRPVHQDNGPLLAALDLAPEWALVTEQRLNAHLRGELQRQGIRPDSWVEYELWVFPVDRDGQPQRNARFRWGLPAEIDGEDRR